MKISRLKKAHRYMNFFRNNFGFHKPYQLLIDGTFCFAALTEKIQICEQLAKYFESEVKILTTPCVIIELEKLGPGLFGALNIAKQFPTHKCGHGKKPVPASQCLLSMLGSDNPNRYILVTQDQSLRESARDIAGTPIMYLHHKAPTLEKPSSVSEETAQTSIENRTKVSDYQLETLRKLKTKELGLKRLRGMGPKRRKPKGPNPLSCKKKKTKPQLSQKRKAEDEGGNGSETKRRRRKVKIPQHVRDHWTEQQNLSRSVSSAVCNNDNST